MHVHFCPRMYNGFPCPVGSRVCFAPMVVQNEHELSRQLVTIRILFYHTVESSVCLILDDWCL